MNDELMEKAKKAKSPEEIVAISEQYGVKLTLDEAKGYFDRLTGCELSDDELDAAAGGGCGNQGRKCPKCGVEMRKTGEGNGNFSMKYYFVCDVCGHKEKQ